MYRWVCPTCQAEFSTQDAAEHHSNVAHPQPLPTLEEQVEELARLLSVRNAAQAAHEEALVVYRRASRRQGVAEQAEQAYKARQDAERQFQFAAEHLAPDLLEERKRLRQDQGRLLRTLIQIHQHTDSTDYDPDRYRFDDQEGCLDTVEWLSLQAINGNDPCLEEEVTGG